MIKFENRNIEKIRYDNNIIKNDDKKQDIISNKHNNTS